MVSSPAARKAELGTCCDSLPAGIQAGATAAALTPPLLFVQVLSKKGRWNFKDRQKKFKTGLDCEYVPLPPGSKELVDELWPLYRK